MDNTPNEITMYLHCGLCLSELPAGVSAKEYARTQTGITADGRVQVWCNRHEANVVIFDDVAELQKAVDAVGCGHCHTNPMHGNPMDDVLDAVEIDGGSDFALERMD